MALKVTKDGFIVIKTKKDAAEALEAFQRMKAELDELREEHGITDLEKDLVSYKAAVQTWMVENDVEQVQCDGFHGTLIKGFYGSHWIATDDDITEGDPAGAKSLQSLIEKKFKSKVKDKGSKARKVWMKITKRVVDHAAVEELVQAGTLSVDEISPAWSEKPKQPFLRIFED